MSLLLQQPTEILLIIASFLTYYKQDIARLRRTCHRLRDLPIQRFWISSANIVTTYSDSINGVRFGERVQVDGGWSFHFDRINSDGMYTNVDQLSGQVVYQAWVEKNVIRWECWYSDGNMTSYDAYDASGRKTIGVSTTSLAIHFTRGNLYCEFERQHTRRFVHWINAGRNRHYEYTPHGIQPRDWIRGRYTPGSWSDIDTQAFEHVANDDDIQFVLGLFAQPFQPPRVNIGRL